MGIILKTNDLTKKYDNKVVVDNLNIEIKEGVKFEDYCTEISGESIIPDYE